MIKKILWILLFAIIIIYNNNTPIKWYRVEKVIDWDTIIANWIKIRFLWVDAPESTTLRFWHTECFWIESKNYLKKELEWKTIDLKIEWKDKYWRTLAFVFLNWININYELVKNWYAKKYKENQYLSILENEAKSKKLWLWNCYK